MSAGAATAPRTSREDHRKRPGSPEERASEREFSSFISVAHLLSFVSGADRVDTNGAIRSELPVTYDGGMPSGSFLPLKTECGKCIGEPIHGNEPATKTPKISRLAEKPICFAILGSVNGATSSTSYGSSRLTGVTPFDRSSRRAVVTVGSRSESWKWEAPAISKITERRCRSPRHRAGGTASWSLLQVVPRLCLGSGFQPAQPLGELPGAVDDEGEVGGGVGVVPQQ